MTVRRRKKRDVVEVAGKLLDVSIETLGDTVAAPAAIGATALTVDDAAHFSERGGWFVLNGTLIQYTSGDDTSGALTLAAPLAAAAAVGDRVDLADSNGIVAREWIAAVKPVDGDDNDDALLVPVDAPTVPYVREGKREPGAEESVVLDDSDGELKLRTVIGVAPVISAATFIAYGPTGSILVYAGTPTTGNLILAIGGSAGVDDYGNPFEPGLSIIGDFSSGLLNFADPAGGVNSQIAAGPNGLYLLGPDGTHQCVVQIGWSTGFAAALIANGLQVNEDRIGVVYDAASGGFIVGAGELGKYYARHATFSQSSVANNTVTTVTSTATVHQSSDYGSCFSSGVFTSPVAAFYDVSIHANFLASQTALVVIIRKNGTALGAGDTTRSGTDASASITGVWLAAGDTLDFRVLQATGSSATVTGDIMVARRL